VSKGRTALPGPFTGETLKHARLRRELTQDELAARVGVSRASIARWEAGSHEPSDINRVRLDKILKGTIRL
jgi:transcriptional regulator with XRE-family HTH domain